LIIAADATCGCTQDNDAFEDNAADGVALRRGLKLQRAGLRIEGAALDFAGQGLSCQRAGHISFAVRSQFQCDGKLRRRAGAQMSLPKYRRWGQQSSPSIAPTVGQPIAKRDKAAKVF
jgi:hypothetical protein